VTTNGERGGGGRLRLGGEREQARAAAALASRAGGR